MHRQERHRQFKGLVKVRDGEKAYMSSGIIKHPKQLIIPLPQSETVNTSKVVNIPEKLDTPVEAKSNILKESKPDKAQKEYLSGKKKAVKPTGEDVSRLQPQELHSQSVKRKKKALGGSDRDIKDSKFAI